MTCFHTFSPVVALACSLQAGGAEEHRPLRDSFSALRYLSTHPRLANVTEYYSAPENWPQWRQHTGHRFRNILGETHERYLRLPRDDGGGDVEIHMMLLWRWARPRWGQAARSPRRQACPLSTRS